MKRIWIIVFGVAVGLVFLALLALQGRYASVMVRMRQDQFEESVKRSLDQASRDMERNETYHYLDSAISLYGDYLVQLDTTAVSRAPRVLSNPALMGIVAHSLRQDEMPSVSQQAVHDPMSFRMAPQSVDAISQSAENFQRAVRNAYIYERDLLDHVVYDILYSASDKSFEERVNTQFLDACLRMSLERNGVTIPYHFRVLASDGREVYRCPDYNPEGNHITYSQTLYRNDPSAKRGAVVVHFPNQADYVLGVLSVMYPAMAFTLILLVIFIITLILIHRQRKVNEMKKDFVNNMTHELKTPIASISLAAEMLADKGVTKSPQLYENLSGIISSESKRLRFQVEKVLQMSLYERKAIALKPVELNADELIDGVVKTFTLKVTQSGGRIETSLNADNPLVCVDEMHFTNIIFNLMENAVKYRRDTEPLLLRIATRTQGANYVITVQDNGIGIRRDDLKRVFHKFYRVHTGNQHDVKGFGLGLAYVKKMVGMHRGTIRAESELGQWTRFTITIPNIKD